MIEDNPINMYSVGGKLFVKCNFSEIYEWLGLVAKRDISKEFDFCARHAAISHGCAYDEFGQNIFTVARYPCDSHSERFSAEEIFNRLRSAQKKLYECFVPLIAKCFIDFAMDLHNSGLLDAVLQAFDEEMLECDILMEQQLNGHN